MVSAEERAIRAVAIRQLINDQSIQDAFADIEADLMAEWKAATVPAERENLWRAINVLDRLKTWLNTYATSDLSALKRAGEKSRWLGRPQ